MNPQPDKSVIFKKAIAKFKEFTDSKGYAFYEPSQVSSTVGKEFVFLRDGERYMCKYLIKKNKLIFKDGTTF